MSTSTVVIECSCGWSVEATPDDEGRFTIDLAHDCPLAGSNNIEFVGAGKPAQTVVFNAPVRF